MKIHRLLPLLFCSLLNAQDEPVIPPVVEEVEVPPPVEEVMPEKAEIVSEKVDHRIIIEAPAPPQKAPLFFTTAVEGMAHFSRERLTETAVIEMQVIQGEAEKLSVEVLGNAPVVEVHGENLRSWSLRQEGPARYLDFLPKDGGEKSLKVTAIFAKSPLKIPSNQQLTTFGPGSSSGFSATYTVTSGDELRHQLVTAEGVLTLQGEGKSDRLSSVGRAKIVAGVSLSAAEPEPVEFREARLVGEILSEEGSATFRLVGTAHVTTEKPVSFRVLQGRAAPVEAVSTPDYRLKLSAGGYELEFTKAGVYPIDLAFVTPVQAAGEWKRVDFFVPGGAVVPIELKGLPKTALFDGGLPVMPKASEGKHAAFLPASGSCRFAWQPERKTGEGDLFFTSESMEEISVGAGLFRQMTMLTVKTLQGALPALKIQLAGAGEILAVEGENVLSWQVSEKRLLEVVLSRPVTKEASFVIRSQSAVEALPVKTEPLRLTPVGAVRHSGYFRIYNRGAVRIEIMNATGLTQLSPDQYPDAGGLPKSVRQIFHYRYPAANRAFLVSAERVKPEINVSQTLQYELTETDRVLRADLELEIREAAIREWEFFGPADYSVVSVTGADVADYVVGEVEKGARRLKVIFGKEVSGRRLVRVHFEKNEAAKAGSWALPTLSYPGSTVVAGELGVSVAPGFRISPEGVDGLAEMPLARLLKRGANLQQAFRIRSGAWKAAMKVEALSQNVQADSYHYYSLKEGTAYVSVLLNYFVAGAPVSEWKLSLPTGIEHLAVDGRDVRDYREVENFLIVPLHRPVMGAYQLLVTYEQKADSSLVLGELAAEEVQAERGFIQVVSPDQVELSTSKGDDHLLALDPLELPAEYQLMSHAPTLKAWQYQRRPFQLEASVSWFDRGKTERQIVEFAELTSRISRDGGVITVSNFDVRTRDSQELKLAVPEGLEIREVSVNGKQVTLRKDGELRLIPLPANVSPNVPVRVSIRSNSSGVGEEVRLLTPSVNDTTQLMTSWKVMADTGYQLRPEVVGGMRLLTPYSEESGFRWIENKALMSFTLLVIAWIFGSWLMKVPTGVRLMGAALVLFAAVGAFYLGAKGMDQQIALPEVLEYRTPVKAADSALSVTVAHVQDNTRSMSDLGLFLILISIALVFGAWKMREFRRLMIVAAVLFFTFGILSQVGGAGWFFLVLGIVILALWWRSVKECRETMREFYDSDEDDFEDDEDDLNPDPSPKGGLTALFLVGLLSCFSATSLEARQKIVPSWKAGDLISEIWEIRDRRLISEGAFQVTGKAGEVFLLVQAPATLTQFEGENLKVVTEGGNYLVVPTKDGTFQAKFSYQAPAAEVVKGVPVLTGLSSVKTLTVNYEAAGWSIESAAAVRQKTLEGKGSSAKLWMAPEQMATVVLSPRARNVAAEVSRFYAEVDDLFIPGPGVVDGRHRVKIRPAQGQVKQLVLTVAEGFTVSDVRSELVGPWRFDPVKRQLTVELAPFQSKPFFIEVGTQRALAELPAEVVVAPMRVQGAAGEVGMLALAFGKEAQLDRDEPKGMSLVNLADFSAGMLPRDRENRATASLQKVYRYSKGAASLKLKVAPVSPEVRVDSKQRLALGEERTVLAVDLTAAITRAGIFRLSFPLPAGFEVESLTGAALNHWAEVDEKGRRVVVMNLNGKTIGTQAFSVVLTGSTPNLPVKSWTVPKVSLLEANRQSGQLVIVPGRGIRLKVETRKDLSALDPRSVGGTQAGSLAFRLLQKSWALVLEVDQLAPSVAARVLQDLDLREGRVRARVDLRLQVDHASIRELEIILPNFSESDAQTVRVSGSEVRDIVNIEGDRWRVRFKRRVIGEVPLRVEFEQSGSVAEVQALSVVGVRQQETFLALRPGARLRVEAKRVAGWDMISWETLPKSLFQLDRSGAPAAFLRSTQTGAGAVPITLKRHTVISGARLRVKRGSLLTVLSSQGELMNQAELHLETMQRGSLVLTLPPQSRLFGVLVNEESTLVVQDGDSFRFNVTGDAGGTEAKVRFTYATSLGDQSIRDLNLEAFKVGEPLENVTWTISIPEGYRVSAAGGDLNFENRDRSSSLDRGKYRKQVSAQISKKEGNSLSRLNQASDYFKAGDQSRGSKTLEQVYNQGNLDAASNEDVAVKMENVARQQAVIGLNTRRQRLYNDNEFSEVQQVGDAAQIEAAIRANPVFAGNLNFGNDDYQNILNGNDADVNRMLDTIAMKWIRNQRITEPVNQVIDPVIPDSGQRLVFTRKIQVDGDEALALGLDLESRDQEGSWAGRLWIFILVLISVIFVWKPWREGNAR